MTNALTSFAKFCDELAPCIGPFLEKAAEVSRALQRAQLETCTVQITQGIDDDYEDQS